MTYLKSVVENKLCVSEPGQDFFYVRHFSPICGHNGVQQPLKT